MKISRRLKWVEYVPDLGDNRDHADPLVLEVFTGLTKSQLEEWQQRIADAARPLLEKIGESPTIEAVRQLEHDLDAATGAVVGEFVRIKGQHTFEGQPLETIAQYIAIANSLADPAAKKELLALVPRLNTFTETDAVFSERLSGGLATTPRRSAANKGSQTDGR